MLKNNPAFRIWAIFTVFSAISTFLSRYEKCLHLYENFFLKNLLLPTILLEKNLTTTELFVSCITQTHFSSQSSRTQLELIIISRVWS